MRIEQVRKDDFANQSPAAHWGSGPCRVLKDTCHKHPRGVWLLSRVVWRIAGKLLWKYRTIQITTALMPKILCCASIGSDCSFILMFFRNNSADVNSYTDFFFSFFFKTSKRGGIKPSFLLLSTKKRSFHGNPCFHGTCCIALQRSFIKRHIYTRMLSCECGRIL